MNTKNTLLRERFNTFKNITQEETAIIQNLKKVLSVGVDTTILDIGAGEGIISRSLQSNTSNVALVEIDEFNFPEGITVFRNTWEEAEIDKNYDIVLASHVWGHFHHICTTQVAFAKMMRSVEVGGKLVLCYNTNEDIVGTLIEESKKWFKRSQYDIFDESLLEGLMYDETYFSVLLEASSFEELAGLVQVLIIVSDEEFESRKTEIITFLKDFLDHPSFQIRQKIVSITCR